MTFSTLATRLRTVFSFDLRSLALFRVMLALVVLADLALRSLDLRTFYTDAGVLPRADLLEIGHRWHWSFHVASGELWWQVVLFVVAALFALALLVGYRTRLASIGTFLMVASLLNRNPLVLQGGDQLLGVICFWAMFLPLGARRSVDAALRPEKRDRPNQPLHPPEGLQPYFSIATIAITLQVLYLYTFTALMKTGDAWITRFDAAYYAVSLQHFATPIGTWFATFPAWLLKGATLFVLVVEFTAPLLVLLPFLWPRLRLLGLALLASLHVAFGLMLHIGLFPLIDLTSLALLLPGAAWTWLLARRHAAGTRREQIVIHYDRDCGFCLKTCLILRELLLLPDRLVIRPAQDDATIGALLERENSWVVTDADDRPRLHWHAMAFLFRESPLFRPLGWLMSLPPFVALGNAVYGQVQRYRYRLSEFTARTLAWRTMRLRPTITGSLLAAFFFYVVTAYNVVGLPQVRGQKPPLVDHAARMTRLDQHWNMFAPYPLTLSSYALVPGVLRNEEQVDLMPLTSSKADWTAPESFYGLYDGYRWRKYLGRVDSHENNAVRRAYGDWLCRSWNTPTRTRETQLATLEVHFVKYRTNTEGAPKARSSRMAWRHWCFAEFAPKKS